MGGAHSRRKGRTGENELVGYLNAHNYPARRISEGGMPGPDITAFNGRLVEVKRRARVPSVVIEGWLRDVNMAAYRADGGEWTVVIRLTELLDLLDEAEDGDLLP